MIAPNCFVFLAQFYTNKYNYYEKPFPPVKFQNQSYFNEKN